MNFFILLNEATGKICRASHATFDEAQLSTPIEDLTPNSLAIWGDLQRSPNAPPPSTTDVITPPEYFCVLAAETPFPTLDTINLEIICTYVDLGLVLQTDPMSFRNIIVDVREHSSAANLYWTRQLQFHTLVQIDGTPVFTVREVMDALATLDVAVHDIVSLIVAPYRPDSKSQASPLPQIAIDQLRIVYLILCGWDLNESILLVTAANATNMADGTKHTRRTCLKGPDRDKWIGAEFNQLDKHHSYGMYRNPIPRSSVPSDAKVVRPIWNYTQKGSGEHKARKCMDGKQLVRMGATIGNTYAACMEQHCLRLFIALSAYLGNLIQDGDVVNAYAHAPAQGTSIYISVDEVFQAW
jgi:hypothetical protein